MSTTILYIINLLKVESNQSFFKDFEVNFEISRKCSKILVCKLSGLPNTPPEENPRWPTLFFSNLIHISIPRNRLEFALSIASLTATYLVD